MNSITELARRFYRTYSGVTAETRFPIPIDSWHGNGFVEAIEGSPLPLMRASGWFSARTMPAFSLSMQSGREVPPLTIARFLRSDAALAKAASAPFSGFRVSFMIDSADQPQRLLVEGASKYAFPPEQQVYGTLQPHYSNLYSTEKVLGRSAIYGFGPPVDVSAEFKRFASIATGRVLDFGCGNGDLIAHLAAQGRDARGLELDEPRIREHLKPAVADRITLYAGGRPLPYEDGSFDWVVSTEVIEHIPDIADYVSELARILAPTGHLLLTTPDISSIPSSFPANCVPWHLLESTHVNFFTPRSVEVLFSPHFQLETLYCLGSGRVNGLFVPGSIGAVLARRLTLEASRTKPEANLESA